MDPIGKIKKYILYLHVIYNLDIDANHPNYISLSLIIYTFLFFRYFFIIHTKKKSIYLYYNYIFFYYNFFICFTIILGDLYFFSYPMLKLHQIQLKFFYMFYHKQKISFFHLWLNI